MLRVSDVAPSPKATSDMDITNTSSVAPASKSPSAAETKTPAVNARPSWKPKPTAKANSSTSNASEIGSVATASLNPLKPDAPPANQSESIEDTTTSSTLIIKAKPSSLEPASGTKAKATKSSSSASSGKSRSVSKKRTTKDTVEGSDDPIALEEPKAKKRRLDSQKEKAALKNAQNSDEDDDFEPGKKAVHSTWEKGPAKKTKKGSAKATYGGKGKGKKRAIVDDDSDEEVEPGTEGDFSVEISQGKGKNKKKTTSAKAKAAPKARLSVKESKALSNEMVDDEDLADDEIPAPQIQASLQVPDSSSRSSRRAKTPASLPTEPVASTSRRTSGRKRSSSVAPSVVGSVAPSVNRSSRSNTKLQHANMVDEGAQDSPVSTKRKADEDVVDLCTSDQVEAEEEAIVPKKAKKGKKAIADSDEIEQEAVAPPVKAPSKGKGKAVKAKAPIVKKGKKKSKASAVQDTDEEVESAPVDKEEVAREQPDLPEDKEEPPAFEKEVEEQVEADPPIVEEKASSASSQGMSAKGKTAQQKEANAVKENLPSVSLFSTLDECIAEDSISLQRRSP